MPSLSSFSPKLHPSRKSNHRIKVCVAGFTAPDHVSVWDLEKLVCNELYHVAEFDTHAKLNAREFELLNVDEDKSDAMPSRILGSLALDPHLAAQPSDTGKDRTAKGSGASAGAVRGFVMSMHASSDSSEPRHSFLVTSGPDWKIRFWDTDRIASSTIVNGNDKDEKAAYTASKLGNDTSVFTEQGASVSSDKSRGVASPVSGRAGTTSPVSIDDAESDRGSQRRKKEGREPKVARYDVIRASAPQLLKGHKDTVTAIALLERPFGMIISADRAGVVYVFRCRWVDFQFQGRMRALRSLA